MLTISILKKTVEIHFLNFNRRISLSHQDSNLDRQNQKLQCYHYTMRQSLGLISKAVQRYEFFLSAKTFLKNYSEIAGFQLFHKEQIIIFLTLLNQ